MGHSRAKTSTSASSHPRLNVVILSLMTLLYFGISQFCFMVPINLRSQMFWSTIIIWACLITVIAWYLVKRSERNRGYCGNDEPSALKKFATYALIGTIASIVIYLIACLISGPFFHAQEYANLITIADGDEETEIPDIETDTMIVVDMKTAEKYGDGQLSYVENPMHYEVDDEYNLMCVNGEYYRISPLNYGGLFKALKANNIPAYIQVDATTAGKEAQSSNAVNLDTPMEYSPSAILLHKLGRHLHFKYPTYILGKSFFELSDDLTPYWITPVQTPSIGLFGGTLENSIIVTNAVTGECTEYPNSETPDWIDHAHSVSYLFELVGYHYKYQDGYLNSIFSKTNVYNTSFSMRSEKTDENESEFTPFEGYNWLIGKDGKIYAYTGITPANNASTNFGFVMIDARTAEAKFYTAPGADEQTAQHAAEGLVQDLRYSANFPTIVDINGELVYFMSLKDNSGSVKRYAICDVKNYTKVVEAASINEAISKFTGLSTSFAPDEENQEPQEETELTGTVASVRTAEKSGNTYFFFMLNDDEHIYVSSIDNSSMQPFMLTENASVTITYHDSEEQGIRVVTAIKF